MKISVLNENTAGKRGFLAEHGLSLLIEHGGKRFLFDAGQTGVFLHNAEKLGEDLTQLDGIILSHGHFDHCGGLEFFGDALPRCPVYVRKNAFLNKQAVNEDKKTYRILGIPWKRELLKGMEILTEDRQEIAPGVFWGIFPTRFHLKKGRRFSLLTRAVKSALTTWRTNSFLSLTQKRGFVCLQAAVMQELSTA